MAFQGDLLLGLSLACASGTAPLLTWIFFRHRFHTTENFDNIKYSPILGTSLFFAVLNSAQHQLMLFRNGIATVPNLSTAFRL